MSAVAFGYTCQECGKGTVREQLMSSYSAAPGDNREQRGSDNNVAILRLCGSSFTFRHRES